MAPHADESRVFDLDGYQFDLVAHAYDAWTELRHSGRP